MYLFQPKVYSWKRIPQLKKRSQAKEAIAHRRPKEKKLPSPEELETLARMLDTEGKERSEKIMKIIKQKRGE